MSTCNWLDLETLVFQKTMSKNLLGHCHILRQFLIQHLIIHDIFHYINVKNDKYTKLKMDERKWIWDDNSCYVIHGKYH